MDMIGKFWYWRWFGLFGLVCLCSCSQPQVVLEGNKAMEGGNYDLAVERYRVAVREYPEERVYRERLREARRKAARAHYERGVRLRGQGKVDLKEVLEEFERTLRYAPDHKEALRGRSEVRNYMRLLRRKILEARRAKERADWFRAEQILWPELRYTPTFPEIGELWKEVAYNSYRIRLEEGRRYFQLKRYRRARREFQEACRLGPGKKEAQELLAKAERFLQAQDMTYRAAKLVEKGEYREAIALLERARKLNPKDQMILAFFWEATRKGAKSSLDEVEHLRNSGKWLEAFGRVLEAERIPTNDEELRKRLKDREKDLRKSLAARWYALADSLEARGLYMAAWVWFRKAQLIVAPLGKDFLNCKKRLEAIEGKFAKAVVYRLVVLPDGGGESVREGALEAWMEVFLKRLRKAFSRFGVRVYSHRDLRGNLVEGQLVSGVLRVRLERFQIEPSVFSERREKRYLVVNGKKLNPRKREYYKQLMEAKEKLERAEGEYKRFRQREKQKEVEVQRARRELLEYRRTHPLDANLTPEERAAHPYSKEIQRREMRISVLEDDLNSFRRNELASAKKRRDQFQARYQSLRKRYFEEPTFLDNPQYRVYRYDRLKVKKVGRMEVRFTLYDAVAQKTFFNETLGEQYEEEDSCHYGFAPAGIGEDKLELSSNGYFRQKLFGGLLKKCLPRLGEAFSKTIYRYEEAMRRYRDRDIQLHYGVMSWRLRKARKERGVELAKRILDISSYDIEKDKLELRLKRH